MKVSGFLKAFLGAAVLSFMMSGVSHAADQGTAAEEFTHVKTFKDRDLYVVYTEFNGNVLAHGATPSNQPTRL